MAARGSSGKEGIPQSFRIVSRTRLWSAAVASPSLYSERAQSPTLLPPPPRGTNKEELIPEAQTALTKFARDLTALAKEGKLDPVIGRNDELRR